MKPTGKEKENIVQFPKPGNLSSPIVGRIVESDQPDDVMVEFDGGGPVRARLLETVDRTEASKKENVGRDVLLMFDRGSRAYPIIIGLLEKPVQKMVSVALHPEGPIGRNPVDAVIDNDRIVLDAKREIVLKCGKGSITINKDGKIVILGTNLISRSRGRNKIKGASVSIN